MSDFTKEELKEIHTCIYRTMDEYSDDEEGSLQKLADKVQSIINSYCEHELSSPILSLVKGCIKCKTPIEHKRWELSNE